MTTSAAARGTDDAAPPGDTAAMTIDELARVSGVTTRNIRAYQARGLLSPPRLDGRTGYYDGAHLLRLDAIGRLQARGFSLAAIAELLTAWDADAGLAEVLGFETQVSRPWFDESPQTMPLADVTDRLGLTELTRPEHRRLVERAMASGVLAADPDGSAETVVVPSPRLLDVGRELLAIGYGLDVIFDEIDALRRDAARIAERFTAMFADHVWAPFAAAGYPAEGLGPVAAKLERTRPLGPRAAAIVLDQAIEASARAHIDAAYAAYRRDGTPDTTPDTTPNTTPNTTPDSTPDSTDRLETA